MKLGEVCLFTNDVRRLAAFYRQLMDIEECSDDAFHQFILSEEPMLTICNDGQHRHSNGSVVLAFTVTDIHAAHQKLLSMQADILQPPIEQPWGAVNLIFLDPDGNTVYLRQLP